MPPSTKPIASYPLLFGILIGLVMGGAIIVLDIWFPSAIKAWETHEPLVQTTFITVFTFVVSLCVMWRWRHRRAFWLRMLAFFVLHTLSVLLYTAKVGAISIRQWMILLPLEGYAIAFFVLWPIRSSNHLYGSRLEQAANTGDDSTSRGKGH